MAFSTLRGRPRTAPAPTTDPGTPELRLKHALGLTAEPIDLCLEKQLITADQHWCGLHLRWLYTLRYGAPSLSTRYADKDTATTAAQEDPTWRAMREQEYQAAVALLTLARCYECVMRLCVFNELPPFLNPRLRTRSWQNPALVTELTRHHAQLREGLDILAAHWRRRKMGG